MIDDCQSLSKRVSTHPGTSMLEKHGPGGKAEEIQDQEKEKNLKTRLAWPDLTWYYQRAKWTTGIAYGRVVSPCSSVGSMTATPQLRLHIPLVAFYNTVGLFY